MKKLLFKLLFWILIILFIFFSIIFGLGYLKYKNSIDKISIIDKVQQIRENENYTKLENISTDYKNAVVAIEDHRFFEHNGIDILSIFRSAYVNLKSKSLTYGASTITQQVGRLMYFGNGYYGITEASQGYFDKSPNDLTLYESTYLAGLPNAPSVYSENDELAKERRFQVENAMKKYGYIDE